MQAQRRAILIAAAIHSLSTPSTSCGSAPAPPLNVILLMDDDLGKWHLGAMTADEPDAHRGGNSAWYSPPWEHGFDVSFATEARVPTFDPLVRQRGRSHRRVIVLVRPEAPRGRVLTLAYL